jgi:hypothetical protein
MIFLSEDEVRIGFPNGTRARRFDDDQHGLSHCMKAVDFIVELADRILFIELKDPDNSKAKAKDKADFMKRLSSGEINRDLALKYRDSYIYELSEDRAKKPVYYWVLIAAAALDAAELLTRTDALKKYLPVEGPDGRKWARPFVSGCAVMNIESWNRVLPNFPASRS